MKWCLAIISIQLSKERLPTTAFAQPLENYPYLPVKTLKENGDGTFNVTFLHAVNLDLSRNTSVTTVQNIQSKQVQIPESGKKNGSKKIKIQEIRIEEGTYDGNIIISIPDVTITGSGSKKTIIHGSITVTGKKAKNIHLILIFLWEKSVVPSFTFLVTFITFLFVDCASFPNEIAKAF